MLVGIATGGGLQDAIDAKMSAFHGQWQVRGYQQPLSADAAAIEISPRESDRLTQAYPKAETYTASFKAGMARTENQIVGAQLFGLSTLPSVLEKTKLSGRLPHWPSNEVWVSTEFARQLGLALDSSFEMYFSRDPEALPTLRYFTVVGLYSTGMQEWDAQMIFCHERQIQKLNRWEKTSHQALLFHFHTTPEKEDLEAFRQLLPMDWDVYTTRQDFPQLYKWLDLFDNNTWLLGIILTLVAAFNAAVVVFIRVIERRRSLAILRTMGASTRSLIVATLTLFSRSVFLGLLIGNALAVCTLGAQDLWNLLPLDPDTYYVYHVPVKWDWVAFTWANMLIFGAIIGTSWLPAKILSKIHPSQVLRMQ